MKQKVLENIMLKKKSNKTPKAKVKLGHDQGPVWFEGQCKLPDQCSEWTATLETVPLSSLGSTYSSFS